MAEDNNSNGRFSFKEMLLDVKREMDVHDIQVSNKIDTLTKEITELTVEVRLMLNDMGHVKSKQKSVDQIISSQTLSIVDIKAEHQRTWGKIKTWAGIPGTLLVITLLVLSVLSISQKLSGHNDLQQQHQQEQIDRK